jgi:hypothetical protein
VRDDGRDTSSRAFVVGRKGYADVAVIQDRIVRAVNFLDLIEGLSNEDAL